MFKDGSFQNKVTRREGARVRGETRLIEMAKAEAEAKLGEALRQTKRELKQMEKQNKEKEKESEERHKRDEIVTRTAERDREKAERERRDKHKRQLEELNKELEQDREDDNRDTRQLIRELRQELKLKEEELIVAKEGSVTLLNQRVKEQLKTERHKKACATWQARHADLVHTQEFNGEHVTALERKVKQKTREFVTLRKKLEATCSAHEEEMTKKDLQAQVCPALLCVFLFFLFVASNVLIYFSQVHEKYQKKLEETNEKEKTLRKEAELEARVATELMLVQHQLKKTAENDLKVMVRVRLRVTRKHTGLQDKPPTRQTQDKTDTRQIEEPPKKKRNPYIGSFVFFSVSGLKSSRPPFSLFTISLFSFHNQIFFLTPTSSMSALIGFLLFLFFCVFSVEGFFSHSFRYFLPGIAL